MRMVRINRSHTGKRQIHCYLWDSRDTGQLESDLKWHIRRVDVLRITSLYLRNPAFDAVAGLLATDIGDIGGAAVLSEQLQLWVPLDCGMGTRGWVLEECFHPGVTRGLSGWVVTLHPKVTLGLSGWVVTFHGHSTAGAGGLGSSTISTPPPSSSAAGCLIRSDLLIHCLVWGLLGYPQDNASGGRLIREDPMHLERPPTFGLCCRDWRVVLNRAILPHSFNRLLRRLSPMLLSSPER